MPDTEPGEPKTLLEAALGYAREGYRVLPLHDTHVGVCSCGGGDPCPPGPGKHPRIQRWQHKATTDEAVIRSWWRKWPHANVGTLMGDGRFVIDVDVKHGDKGLESFKALQNKLGELTETRHTSTPSGGFHREFLGDVPSWGKTETSRFAPGIDIQSTGTMVVRAPSRTTVGEYAVVDGRAPVPCPEAWLIALRNKKAAGEKGPMKVPEKIRDGTRDTTLFQLACSLQGQGLPYNAVLAAVRETNREICDPPKPEKIVVEKVKRAFTYDAPEPLTTAKRQAVLAELLQQYIYITELERFYNRTTGEMWKDTQLRDYHAPRFDLKGRGVAGLLLKSPDLERVVALTYAPGQPLLIEEDGRHKLNEWRPGNVVPAPGDPKPYLEHVAYIFDDDEGAIKHFLDWCATHYQKPGTKIRHALVLQGIQGIGKSYLAYVMRLVLGPHNVEPLEAETLKSSFNSWARGKQLVVIEEMMTFGRMDVMNKLKPWITQDEITINQKYLHTYTLPNRMNFLLLTNHENAIVLRDRKDRRYWLWYSNAVETKSPQYYNELFRWTAQNAGVIAQCFLDRDLSGFSADRAPPMTTAKQQLIRADRPEWELWVIQKIKRGEHPFDRDLIAIKDVQDAVAESEDVRSIAVSQATVTIALNAMGAVRCGQVRLQGSEKVRLWAVRHPEQWKTATEKALREHYLQGKPAEEERGDIPF